MPNKGGKPCKVPEKRQNRNYTINSKKAQIFLDNFVDESKDTFFNPIKCLDIAGYSKKSNQVYEVGRLLSNQNILNGMLSALKKNSVYELVKAETAKVRVWKELELALEECKPRQIQHEDGQIETLLGDMTNRLRVIDMMGKFHQLWSDKNVVSIEVSRQLSDSYLKELRELSKLSMSGVIDAELSDQSAATRLLQSNSGVVSSPCDIQDVGDDTTATDHNSADIDKCSNDKDLQNQ